LGRDIRQQEEQRMVGGSSLVGLPGQERNMFGTQLAETGCAVAKNLFGARFELPLDFLACVTRAQRFLNHGIQAAAASLKSKFVRMLLQSGEEGIMVEAVRIIGEKGPRHEDEFRGVFVAHFPKRGIDLAVRVRANFRVEVSVGVHIGRQRRDGLRTSRRLLHHCAGLHQSAPRNARERKNCDGREEHRTKLSLKFCQRKAFHEADPPTSLRKGMSSRQMLSPNEFLSSPSGRGIACGTRKTYITVETGKRE